MSDSCGYVFDYSIIPNATTQYTSFLFNSMVRFGDKYIGSCNDGIFELNGDSDNDIDIDAYFELQTTDVGILNPKKIRFIYLGYEADGDLLMTATADESVSQTKTIDSLKSGQQYRRISLNRNMFGRYLSLKISNVDGCDFGLDAIDVTVVVRNSIR